MRDFDASKNEGYGVASHREGGYIGLKGAVIKGGEHGMVAIINITY